MRQNHSSQIGALSSTRCAVFPAQVLAIYPTAIRRRVLRHLYLSPLAESYMLRSCKQRFLDALLAAARVELFMPKVSLACNQVLQHILLV